VITAFHSTFLAVLVMEQGCTIVGCTVRDLIAHLLVTYAKVRVANINTELNKLGNSIEHQLSIEEHWTKINGFIAFIAKHASPNPPLLARPRPRQRL
jgi:hypothetical protein